MSKQTSGLKLLFFTSWILALFLTKPDYLVFVRQSLSSLCDTDQILSETEILRFDILYWDRLQSFSTQYLQSTSFLTSPKRSSRPHNFLGGFQVARGRPEADRSLPGHSTKVLGRNENEA